MMNKLSPVLSWIVTLLTPITIIMLAVRLLMTPIFPEIEYRMPGFPEDGYGFTLQDRLLWSKPSIEYLINNADISFLGELRFSDGTPIYNERELSHMYDVKMVVQMLLRVWYVALAILVALAVWAWRGDWWRTYLLGWQRGGFFTLGLLGFLSLAAAINFWQFFTYFHLLFFKGDSWLFYFSDTLIRLFPIRFWQDAFIYIGAFTILSALWLAFGLRKLLRRGISAASV